MGVPLSSSSCINSDGGCVKRDKSSEFVVDMLCSCDHERKVERRMKRMWGVGLKRLKKNCHDDSAHCPDTNLSCPRPAFYFDFLFWVSLWSFCSNLRLPLLFADFPH